MKTFVIGLFLLVCSIARISEAQSLQPAECSEALNEGLLLVNDPSEKTKIRAAFEEKLLDPEIRSVTRGYCGAVLRNVKSKLKSRTEAVTFEVEDIIRTTIEFEAFRTTTYLTSGVLPKRYFGFLDIQGNTASYEKELLQVATAAAKHLNAYAASIQLDLRVTPKEIILTHLAEGGALLLTDEYETIDRVHPVRHIGLDDYRPGFNRFPGLLEELDERFSTKLGSVRVKIAGKSFLLRPLTFRESVLATSVLYLYEKELTARYRAVEKRSPLMELSLDEQFIHTSLVYNSGILFSDERVKLIEKMATGEYLEKLNDDNRGRKPNLPVLSYNAALARLSTGSPLPRQLTSWSAVYHVVQRYSTWVAIKRFSHRFDDAGYLVSLHKRQ